MEVWLHQHIFKVGWLVTNQYQTTTILYYAFFLPGILLNQITIWTVAGFLNVRAKHSLSWPQKQEIGELKLTFVQLTKNVDPFRLAIINTAPLIVGLIATWHIANNTLHVPAFLASVEQSGVLGNVTTSLAGFTTTPDFWLWIYIAFTISNTMMPDFQNLRGWRILVAALVVAVIALYALGVGNQVVMDNLQGPITDSLNALSSIFAVIIGLDIFMVLVLGTIEAVIERITGDSATFENGRMITMRRSERLARARALAVQQPKAVRTAAPPTVLSSVYMLPLSIPGAPGKDTLTPEEGIIITPDPKVSLPAGSQPVVRSTPNIITGTVTGKPPTPAAPAPASTPRLAGAAAGKLPSPTESKPLDPTAPTMSPASPPSTLRPTNPSAAPTVSSPPSTPRPANPSTAQPSRPMSAPARPPLSPPPSRPALSPVDDEDVDDEDEDLTYEDFEDPA